jgi:beta-lactamase regulating signal transducer with metallopeptidase domain
MLFTYCLLMTLLHSLWQAGIQALLYATAVKTILHTTSAVAKRNLLLLQIGMQVVISAITFFLYYIQPDGQLQTFVQYYTAIGAPLKPYLYSVAPWLISGYFIWLATKTIYLVMAWRRFAVLYKTGLQTAPIDLRLFTKVTADRIGIKKKVQIWLSNNINTPVTFGHIKPIILLPVALVNKVSLQQAEALVIHELTHIKVNDYLLNWLLSFAETIYCFNPAIRYLSKQAQLEREKYCDTNVLHFGKHPVVYAETLLMAAQMQQENIRWQMAAVSNKQQLLKRILFFTGDEATQTKGTGMGKVLAPLLLALAFFVTTALVGILYNGETLSGKKQSLAAVYPAVNLLPMYNPNDMLMVDNAEAPMAIAELPQRIPAEEPPALVKKQPLNNTKSNTEELPELTEDMIGPTLVYPGGLQNVSFNEGELEKEFMVEEENPGTGVKTIKIFVLHLKNGNWVLEPKWMATSRTISIDTALLRLDSLRIQVRTTQ